VEENGEELVHDSEMMPNLVASALKLPSHSTSLHVIKYLALKMTYICFLLLQGNKYKVLIGLTFLSLLQDAMECSVAWGVTL